MTLDSSKKLDPCSPNLWRRAGHALDRGDQWFSSSAGRVFGWVHRESNLATEQAVLAVAEAIGVRKQSIAQEGQRQLGLGDAHSELEQMTESSSFRAPRAGEVDLVWADASGCEASVDQEKNGVDRGLAGLVPLLQALGKVVEQHGEQRYASLAEDDRFWMLIEVIVSLNKTEASTEEANAESVHSTSVETKGAR